MSAGITVEQICVPGPAADEVFAAVVVNVDAPGLRQPFTYLVPPEMTNDLAPGSCVIVPFGTREAVGYVLSLSERAPEALEAQTIRSIESRVTGDGANLPVDVLKTARWIAQTYLADLAQCVRSAIPDAQTAHVVRRYALSSAWREALPETRTPSHRQILLALSGFPDESATESELQKEVGDLKIDSPLRLLRKRGIVREEWTTEAPKTRPRIVNSVRLVLAWDDAESEAVKREAKSPAQARLLRLLALHGRSTVPASEALAAAQATPSALKRLAADGLVETSKLEIRRRPFRMSNATSAPPILTDEQETALESIRQRLGARKQSVSLLYGVTASGKTEVYLRAIAECRRLGRTSLVLVPEIALTAQVVDNFRARIGDRVAVLHSGLSISERRDEWRRIGAGSADVVVGARSAVFAPLENIGLIVVDEEHEGSYKQDNPSPRYHARDVAIARARATGATVVLGSATPAVESFYRAESGEWGMLPLRQRAHARPLPTVEIVDLREGYKKGEPPAGIFSPVLRDAIAARLAQHEQVILFLNRRGFAMFLLCRDCGFSTRCPNCDVSLTYHASIQRLTCHHCGFERRPPLICPSCNGDRIRPFGIGTERVEEEVCGLFPEARVLRMDRDTTAKRGAHLSMLRTFRSGEADILIGTQMVAKGLDFAGVTLVGVISADTALNVPDFRASERAFQLLTQVAGRAGRGRKAGHVIVQTFNPEHESVVAAANHDYDVFYRREIVYRRELGYPPFTRLANIVSTDADASAAEQRLVVLAAHLGGRAVNLLDPVKMPAVEELMILGPAPCALSRLRGKYRYHMLIKALDSDFLRSRLRAALSRLTATERSGISIDIDPMSLL